MTISRSRPLSGETEIGGSTGGRPAGSRTADGGGGPFLPDVEEKRPHIVSGDGRDDDGAFPRAVEVAEDAPPRENVVAHLPEHILGGPPERFLRAFVPEDDAVVAVHSVRRSLRLGDQLEGVPDGQGDG